MGGIQSYLWELWRRLPPERVTVLTTAHPEATDFDRAQPFRVVRTRERVLLPTPGLLRRIEALAHGVGAGVVVLDPVLPVGFLGPRVGLPYAVVVHGAEVSVPGRLPVSRGVLAGALRGAALVVAGGRSALLETDYPDLTVAVGGAGRDRTRLDRLVAATGAPVRLLGRVAEADLPSFVAAGDVHAMPCRRRWAGLEQEGFGIVFLEAAACGVPSVAGDSGGAAEAVASGKTGFVVAGPDDPVAVADALAVLLDDAALRAHMGEAARGRAEAQFGYDRVAATLDEALGALE